MRIDDYIVGTQLVDYLRDMHAVLIEGYVYRYRLTLPASVLLDDILTVIEYVKRHNIQFQYEFKF